METITTTSKFSESMQLAFANALIFIPRLLGFLLILVLGYILSMALGKVVDKLLNRVGFDKMVEKGGIKKALSGAGFHVSDILGKLAFYTVFLFVLQLAFSVFGANPISDLLTRVIVFLPNIFVAIVIVVLSASIAAAVKEILRASLGCMSYGNALALAASAAIMVVGVFAALNQLAIAPAIVNGLFYAVLATVAGIAIVSIGGAGILPMRARWETMLTRMEAEVPKIKQDVVTTTEGPAPTLAG